jgi:hypothetical protein
MEKSEQKFIIKFFFLKGLGSKAIHRELIAVLGSTAYSLTQIKESRACFETGDLSYEDQIMLGHPPQVLEKALSHFLEQFPFTIAEIIAKNFGQSKNMIKEILQRELGLRRFSRRWILYSLSEAQKTDRITIAIDPLNILHRQANHFFL